MARGGYRPDAPQNNFGVSATGGAGNRGTQAPRYMRGGGYGEGKQLLEQQAAAPMAASTPQPRMQTPMPMPQGMPITEFTAPTERPNEPFSTGMPFDPTTPGPRDNTMVQRASLIQTLTEVAQYDPTGEVNELLNYLTVRGI